MNYANPEIEQLFESLEQKNNKALDYMQSEYALMRAGRANPKILDKLTVDYYGTQTPVNQMANIAVPDSRSITIAPWDKTALALIEKAILSANLGVTPQNDGTLIRLNFPQLTEERRKELVKQVKKLAEDTKVVVRNNRRDMLEALKKVKAQKTVSEDLIADYEKETDKIIAKEIENIDKLCKDKEKDTMSV